MDQKPSPCNSRWQQRGLNQPLLNKSFPRKLWFMNVTACARKLQSLVPSTQKATIKHLQALSQNKVVNGQKYDRGLKV